MVFPAPSLCSKTNESRREGLRSPLPMGCLFRSTSRRRMRARTERLLNCWLHLTGGATLNVLERSVVAGTAASVVEQLVRFRALGCSLFVVNPADDRPVRRAEQFEEFAREVIPVLRALAG